MRKIIGLLGVLIIIAIFIVGFMAYFVFSFDPQTKTAYDGVGRELSEAPWIMRLIFDEDRLWAGWSWFIADMIIFWGGIIAGINLAKYGFMDQKK